MHSNYKHLIFFFIITTTLLYSFKPALSVDDKIILPRPGHRKPAITLNHKNHNESYGAKCIDCHHKSKNIKSNKR